jgi:hypothetical protein
MQDGQRVASVEARKRSGLASDQDEVILGSLNRKAPVAEREVGKP